MGLIDKIKNDVKKSGQNKGKFIYFREGVKVRVRFLTDMDDGIEVPFHDSFERSINVPCQEIFGRSCSYCDDDTLRTRSQYIWSVWNYDLKEVQLFMFPVNNCSPIPALMSMYENYGTITDRDYILTVSGRQQNKTFAVVPMDKEKFRNEKAKPFSKSQILKMLDKAFPADDEGEDEDEDEKQEYKKKKTRIQENSDDDDYEDDDKKELPWNDKEKEDYSDKSPQDLYKLCKKRKIDAEIKKPAKYYINLLKEADKAEDDWGDDEDESEDEWEDE
jgi:hypothetical protein